MSRNKDNGERIKLKKGAYKRALRVFYYIKPYRFTFLIGLLFLFLSSAVTMGFPYLLGELFGTQNITALGSQSTSFDLTNLQSADSVVILLFIVFAANAVFSFFRIYLFTSVSEKALFNIRKDAFKRLTYSPISFFDKNKVGELTSRVATDINQLQELLTTILAEFIRQWLTIIISIIVIGMISPKLMGIMLSVVPIVLVLVLVFGRHIKKLSRKTQDAAAASNTILSEVLTGIKNVKSFTNEWYEMARYQKQVESIKKLSIKGAVWRGLFASFIILGLFGSVTIVIWQGVKMVQTGEMNMEMLMKFILFTIFLAASFGGVGSMMGSIQKAVGATERIMDLLETPIEPLNHTDHSNLQLTGAITYESVSFHYETREDVQVLEDISFDVKTGETIALVGPSGSGKSTILSLLLRFYDPTQGKILFDQTDISSLALNELRSHMAIVPQEVILFSGSIKENIAYGKPEASEQEIENAALKANAMEFIQQFPDQLETLVGDRGIQLSGGQKQRIAIARAIIKDPKILLLDEATNALDSESEKLVQDALDELMKGRTSLVIAHRLSTIRNADMILLVDNGNIVERGSHTELQNQGGLYAKLSKMQFDDVQLK